MSTSSYIRPAGRAFAEVTNQVVAAAGTWTQVIPMGRSDYDRAQLEIGIPNTATSTEQRRLCGQLWVTRDAADAYAQSPFRHYFSVRAYPSGITYTTWIPRMRFYSTADDGRLSDTYYGSNSSNIRLESAAIVADTVELTWRNTHPTASRLVTNRIELDMYREVA